MTLVTDRANAFFDRIGVDAGVPTLPERTTKKCDYSAALKQIEIDVSPKGEIVGYLTVFNWNDGQAFVDPYMDIATKGMFTDTYHAMDRIRKARGDRYLMPSLYNHDNNQMVGGVTDLTLDSKGYIYSSQLAMGLRKSQEIYELAKNRMIYASYGYTPTLVEKRGRNRVLKSVDLHEQSFVTFPANALASVISTKQQEAFISYPSSKASLTWAFLQHGEDTSINDRRWKALEPSTTSTHTTALASSSAWNALMPKDSDPYEDFSLDDLVDEVQNALKRIA